MPFRKHFASLLHHTRYSKTTLNFCPFTSMPVLLLQMIVQLIYFVSTYTTDIFIYKGVTVINKL